jgi:membrane glycosyltransferase
MGDMRTQKPQSLKIVLFKMGTVGLWSLAVSCFAYSMRGYEGNYWFVAICGMFFAYLVLPITRASLQVLVCLVSTAERLAARDFSIGIPTTERAALAYCVRARTRASVSATLGTLEFSIRENNDENLLAIYLSDTDDTELVAQEIMGIRELQDRIGVDRVFYFHRSRAWGKKWGAYQDLMLWLRGYDSPVAYLDAKYGKYRRDPACCLFSLAILDQYSAGAMVNVAEKDTGIIGDTSKLRACQHAKVKHLLVSDGDVVWPAGAAIRVVGTMAHPSNREFAIFQPAITIRNRSGTMFAALLSCGHDMWEFTRLAIWKIWRAHLFYGKGGLNIDVYLSTMLQKGREVLAPTTLSHDFVEAMYLRTAYLPYIRIGENVPENYYEDFQRLQRWVLGDIIGMLSETMKLVRRATRLPWRRTDSYEVVPDRTSGSLALGQVRQSLLSPLAFSSLLIVITVQSGTGQHTLVRHGVFELLLLAFLLGTICLTPRILGPIVVGRHLGKRPTRPLKLILLAVFFELPLSTLVFLQQVVDRNTAILRASWTIMSTIQYGKELIWEPSCDLHISLETKSFLNVYRGRCVLVLIGFAWPAFLYAAEAISMLWFASPIWLSFILGPALAKWTGTSGPGALGENRG